MEKIRGKSHTPEVEEGDEYFDPQLMRIVRQGIDIEAWLKSPIGVYVYNKAVQEIQENTSVLVDSPRIETPEAKEAHETIRKIVKLLDWFNDALEEGRRAQQQLEEHHGEASEIESSGGIPDEL